MNARNRCCYEFGSFRLNTEEHILFHEGKVVSLTPKAFDTLLVLVENHGHLVEKDELLEKVWAGSFVEEANVAKHISILRKTLSGNGLKEPFIETIPTRGYRFVAPLTETEVDTPQAVVEVETPHEVKDSAESGVPKKSTRRKAITAVILPVGFIAAFLAVGGWYFLPSLIEGDGPPVEITQVSLSTGFEKVRAGVISPDGKLIAFRRLRQGKQETLAVRRLADGDTIDLVSNLDDNFSIDAAFSPDSKFIYYNLYGKDVEGLYRVPVTGGPGERLVAGRIWSSVTVSPDGNQLAFKQSNPPQTEGKVIVADKDGKNQKAILTANLYELFQVLWSIDGQRLLISRGIMGSNGPTMQSAKWVNKDDKTETEAKELRPLLEQDWGDVRSPVLLKDGSGFLFSGAKTGMDGRQIFHLRAVDGKITQITPNGRGNSGRFSVSDDGKTIVLNRLSRWSFNMISYDPVTKESRQIMNNNKDFVPWRGFSQMPDGRILFANRTGIGNSDIYSMNEDGGNEIRLTTGTGRKVHPVATADGKYIVFFSTTRSGASNLWRMDADGSNPVRLTNYLQKELEGIAEIEKANNSIQITNDGKTVFFAQQPKRGERSQLMKIPIKGGDPVELLPNSQTSDYYPRISPDGEKLAYVGFVYDSKTSQYKFTTYIRSLKEDRVGELEKKIDETDMAGFVGRPRWTADGKALTYYQQKNQIWDIWKLDIETGNKTALTSFESEADNVQQYQWSNDGKKILIVRWLRPFGDITLIRNRDISKKLF